MDLAPVRVSSSYSSLVLCHTFLTARLYLVTLHAHVRGWALSSNIKQFCISSVRPRLPHNLHIQVGSIFSMSSAHQILTAV